MVLGERLCHRVRHWVSYCLAQMWVYSLSSQLGIISLRVIGLFYNSLLELLGSYEMRLVIV